MNKKERKFRKKMELKEYIESAELQQMWDKQEFLRIIQGVIGIFGICILIGAFIMVLGFIDIYEYCWHCLCPPPPELAINNYIILATIIIEGVLAGTILFLERKIRRLHATT